MKGFVEFVVCDFKRKWGQKSTIAVFIVLPIILSLLMTAVFGRGDGKVSFQPPKVALIDNDGGFLSKGLVKFLVNEQMKKEFEFVLIDYDRAYMGMKNQEFSAIVIIPENFTDDFFMERNPEIILIKNPSQGIYPEMVETMLSLFTEGINYLLTFYYPQFNEIASVYKSIKSQTIIPKIVFLDFSKLKSIGKDFYKKSKKLYNTVKNRSFEVVFETKTKKKKKKSLINVVFPGYALFFLLFFANISAVAIVKENNESITQRILLTNFSELKYLTAKIISALLFLLVLSLLFVLCGFFIFGLRTTMLFHLLIIVFLSCISIFSVFFLVSSFSKDENSASNLGMVILFLMGFTGGGMIPINLIPDFLISFSKIFPFYKLNVLFIDLLTKSVFRIDYAFYCVLFSLVCYGLGMFVFKKKLGTG